MTPSRWEYVFALFDTALAMPVAERDAFLSRECRGEAQTRGDVESLLAAHQDATGFLSHGPVPIGDASSGTDGPDSAAGILAPGTRLGVFESRASLVPVGWARSIAPVIPVSTGGSR